MKRIRLLIFMALALLPLAACKTPPTATITENQTSTVTISQTQIVPTTVVSTTTLPPVTNTTTATVTSPPITVISTVTLPPVTTTVTATATTTPPTTTPIPPIYTVIASFYGSNSMTTNTFFTTQSQFKIDYTFQAISPGSPMSGTFTVYTQAGQGVKNIPVTTQPISDTTFAYAPAAGTFYFVVTASNANWSITVSQINV
jgi:hypothetical protein